jgi:phosphate acetyltransferase
MDVLARIRSRAKKAKKNICLPETFDDRVLQAADICLAKKMCRITLIGKKDKVMADAARLGVKLDAAGIVDPETDSLRDEYVNTYCEMRKHKGMTPDEAAKVMARNIYYSAMCVAKGRCDGMVGGSVASSPDLHRALLQVIRPKPGIKTVSSFFIMATKIREFGVNGALIYSDCGLVIDPDPEMLVDIAAASAESCRALLDVEPVVGFLSFSTKGSAKHALVDKVVAATKLFKERYPNIVCDGELQADSALIPAIAERKCKGSPAAGRCNVLIFPDLNAGNICYKITERIGRAQAVGPLLQGLARSGNDLSRGCSAMDIVNAAAVGCLQAATAQG